MGLLWAVSTDNEWPAESFSSNLDAPERQSEPIPFSKHVCLGETKINILTGVRASPDEPLLNDKPKEVYFLSAFTVFHMLPRNKSARFHLDGSRPDHRFESRPAKVKFRRQVHGQPRTPTCFTTSNCPKHDATSPRSAPFY